MRLSGVTTLPCLLILGSVSRGWAAEHSAGVTQHPHHLVRQDEIGRNGHKGSDGSAGWDHKIPPLLHYIFLSGLDNFIEVADNPASVLNKTRFEHCQALHRHWDGMFWDMKMADQLVKDHYSWFLPVWESYRKEVVSPH